VTLKQEKKEMAAKERANKAEEAARLKQEKKDLKHKKRTYDEEFRSFTPPPPPWWSQYTKEELDGFEMESVPINIERSLKKSKTHIQSMIGALVYIVARTDILARDIFIPVTVVGIETRHSNHYIRGTVSDVDNPFEHDDITFHIDYAHPERNVRMRLRSV